MNKLYKEHKKIIYSVTMGVARKTGIPFDELECQANLIFTECANRHPDAIHFDRYLKKSLNWGFYRYARQRKERINELVLQSYYIPYSEELKNNFRNMEIRESFLSYDKVCEITLEDISRDAKKIMEIVFDKKHITEDAESIRPRLCKKHIFNHLKEQGWKTKRILTSFKELTNLVDSYQIN